MSDIKQDETGNLIGEVRFKTGDPSSIEEDALLLAHELSMSKPGIDGGVESAVTGRTVKELVPVLIRCIEKEAERGTPLKEVMFGVTRAIPLSLALVTLPCLSDVDRLGNVLEGMGKDMLHDLESYGSTNFQRGEPK